MNLQETQDYYSRPDIQKEMLRIAKDREVAGAFRDGSYFRRPDIMAYPKDILERVRRGMLAFHCSVERWTNPMQLSPEMKPTDLDNIRKGFDLIIDIDAKIKLEHSKVAAEVVIGFLRDLGVEPTVKFSGNRGFHIAIASEAFPKYVDLRYATASERQHEGLDSITRLYPAVPRTTAFFIREKIKDYLQKMA